LKYTLSVEEEETLLIYISFPPEPGYDACKTPFHYVTDDPVNTAVEAGVTPPTLVTYSGIVDNSISYDVYGYYVKFPSPTP